MNYWLLVEPLTRMTISGHFNGEAEKEAARIIDFTAEDSAGGD